VLGNSFFILDKLYLVSGFATGEAVVGVGFGVYFAAWFVVLVERAEDLIVLVGLNVVMG